MSNKPCIWELLFLPSTSRKSEALDTLVFRHDEIQKVDLREMPPMEVDMTKISTCATWRIWNFNFVQLDFYKTTIVFGIRELREIGLSCQVAQVTVSTLTSDTGWGISCQITRVAQVVQVFNSAAVDEKNAQKRTTRMSWSHTLCACCPPWKALVHHLAVEDPTLLAPTKPFPEVNMADSCKKWLRLLQNDVKVSMHNTQTGSHKLWHVVHYQDLVMCAKSFRNTSLKLVVRRIVMSFQG